MATVRVRRTGALSLQAIKEVNGRQGKGLAERARGIAHERVASAVRSAWQNTLDQVNLLLATGVGNGRGASAAQITDHQGKPVKVFLGGYNPLTKRYRNKDPKSTRFWRKHSGTPTDGRSVNLANAVARALRSKGRVRADPLPLKLAGGNWQFRSTLRPSKLPGVLNKIVLENFVSDTGLVEFKYRTHGERLSSKDERSTFTTVQYPESQRPLLSKVAVALGANTRQSLQKALSTRSRKR